MSPELGGTGNPALTSLSEKYSLILIELARSLLILGFYVFLEVDLILMTYWSLHLAGNLPC